MNIVNTSLFLGGAVKCGTRAFSSTIHCRKTAIVLMNMGGPAKTKDTHDFLYRLFSDEDLIPLGSFQKQLASIIARTRSPKIEKHYDEIGGGSPIRKWTEVQAKGLCKTLDDLSPQTGPHVPYIAFRYADPLTEETYRQMLSDGITRAVAFTQYPQYSYSTTRSSFNELKKVQQELDKDRQISWSFIERWPTHPKFIKTFARLIKNELEKFDKSIRDNVFILFSAHSLPISIIDQGDPYPAEVSATAYAIMQELEFSNPYRVCYQSQVGPRKWLGPQTAKVVSDLEKRPSTKGIVVVPVAFTSDHIETLHEIDIEMKEEMTNPELLKRAQSLNGDAEFIEGLAEIARDHLQNNTANEIESGASIRPYILRI